MDLNQILKRLCDADLDFVVGGGFAAVLHGSTFVTRGLDVCVMLSAENINKLRTVLADLRPVHRMTPQRLSFLTNPDAGVEISNRYLETDAGAVDVLTTIAGVGDFERVRSASVQVELFGRRCRVMSLADLIAAKLALGREKDLLAARELQIIAERRPER